MEFIKKIFRKRKHNFEDFSEHERMILVQSRLMDFMLKTHMKRELYCGSDWVKCFGKFYIKLWKHLSQEEAKEIFEEKEKVLNKTAHHLLKLATS